MIETPTFSQALHTDEAVYSALFRIGGATKKWAVSSLRNEAVLLDKLSESLLSIGTEQCISPIFPEVNVSSKRTILDRKGENNTDLFSSDLGITLSMVEHGQLIKQRTALLQLKVGAQKANDTAFKLDVRQVYQCGHNEHTRGRWFIAVCESKHGIWKLASERFLAKSLTDKQLSKVSFPSEADRIDEMHTSSDWASIAEWTLYWLSEAIGTDSDLSDDNRIEKILEKVRDAEEKKKAGQLLGTEFDAQFAAYEQFLPRVHIEYIVNSGKPVAKNAG